MLRRIIGTCIFLFGFLCLSIAGFAALQAVFEPEKFTPADMIVVLGAGMDADGTLHRSTILRVKKGVALFHAGAAPHMHFTGGMGGKNGPSAGQMMAKLAQSLAVPAVQTSTENKSQSTLQNALFSQPTLKDVKRIILVTEGFHLPRSWASFQWAAWQNGRELDIALSRSTAFRQPSETARFTPVTMVAREGLAWGFNLLRAISWHGAGWYGIADEERNKWLQ